MTESTPVFQTHASAPEKAPRKWLVAGATLASTLFMFGVSHTSPITQTATAAMNLRAGSAVVGSLSGLTAEESIIATALNPHEQSARTARWLVHKNSWATIATTSIHLNGAPFAGLASYSDGIGNSPENATGNILFYLTPMDSTGQDVAKNPHVSVGIAMAQLGHCIMDAQDPTCWKATISGKLLPVEGDAAKRAALQVLYSKHPQMSWWPAGHGFQPFVGKWHP
ncbi:hypothetical protein, variant [Aphanomyces invadans]|uniref:CREG-like beta-barrel domain-containing protein n=1 Tax=Aphanomyces invadans TaxID=157072 RepID=A0A024UTH6_9STRA|nr:hypothetical protein, variant [Aphanomyces invadans]ETW09232.1 hypothetical protein, variant [Aphanomyces invadans]|eukprot:XP_008863037.1 hypothetical protein, variant [Aphanomyces invadans]